MQLPAKLRVQLHLLYHQCLFRHIFCDWMSRTANMVAQLVFLTILKKQTHCQTLLSQAVLHPFLRLPASPVVATKLQSLVAPQYFGDGVDTVATSAAQVIV